MAKVIKTARGRTLDMAGLMAKQEKTRAVSNVKSVNARGDEIDSTGKIVKPVNQVVAESYASQVGSKTAQASRSSANPNAPLSPKQKRELETQRQTAKETPLLDKLAETQKQTSVVEQESAQLQKQTSVVEQESAQLLEDDFVEDEDEALDIEAIKKACLDAQAQKDAEAKKKGK
jgi:hypothetical protein